VNDNSSIASRNQQQEQKQCETSHSFISHKYYS
jgi:hypothetical protein